jgi:L-threonylcarbamoyladenylate synthase
MTITLKSNDPFDEAIRVFKSGGVIAFPTETFYGLGVDPFNAKAVERLFLLKGRSFKDPIPIVAGDMEMVERLVETVPPAAEILIQRYWPGPLTIVFKARAEVPELLTARTGKIGVRISSSPVVKKLLASLKSPLTSTSANPSGEPPALEPGEVLEYFEGRLDLLIDGGRLTAKKPSTVMDVTGERLVVLREGAVPAKDFSDLLS